MKLPVVIVRDGITPPQRAYRGDAGLDLQAAEAVVLPPLERVKIGTGLRVEIPEGYVGLIAARSGLATRHGITHLDAPGVIDSGYRGEVHLLLYNTDRREPFKINVGDRMGQLIVVPYAAVEVHRAQSLTESERGSRGLGSSGLASADA